MLASDLSSNEAPKKSAAEMATRAAEPQYVVNNAGFGLMGPAVELEPAEQLAIIDLNVRVLTELSLAFVDSLSRHRGGIFNVASVASFLPGPGMAVFFSAKGFVLSRRQALHPGLSDQGSRWR